MNLMLHLLSFFFSLCEATYFHQVEKYRTDVCFEAGGPGYRSSRSFALGPVLLSKKATTSDEDGDLSPLWILLGFLGEGCQTRVT